MRLILSFQQLFPYIIIPQKICNRNPFIKLKKKRNINLIVFFIITIFFCCAYVLSFYSNNLLISIAVGIASVVLLVLYYYGFIFDKIISIVEAKLIPMKIAAKILKIRNKIKKIRLIKRT